MSSSNSSSSLGNIVVGILATVIGGVIVAFIIEDARFDPNRERVAPSSNIESQLVDWVPLDSSRGPGMCINACAEFIAWPELKEELQQKILPQVGNIPVGSTVALTDFEGQPNWIVQVIDPNGNEVANIWIGNDPLNKWDYDGLVRVGYPYTSYVVWATFRRYSDGSYRKQ